MTLHCHDPAFLWEGGGRERGLSLVDGGYAYPYWWCARGLKEVETQGTFCGEAICYNKANMKMTLVQLEGEHCQTEQVKRYTIETNNWSTSLGKHRWLVIHTVRGCGVLKQDCITSDDDKGDTDTPTVALTL